MTDNVRNLLRKNEEYQRDENRIKIIMLLIISIPIMGYFANLAITEISEDMGEALSAQMEMVIESSEESID